MSLAIQIIASLALAAVLLYGANHLSLEWHTKRILTMLILALLVIWLAYIVSEAVGVIPQ